MPAILPFMLPALPPFLQTCDPCALGPHTHALILPPNLCPNMCDAALTLVELSLQGVLEREPVFAPKEEELPPGCSIGIQECPYRPRECYAMSGTVLRVLSTELGNGATRAAHHNGFYAAPRARKAPARDLLGLPAQAHPSGG
eukprot:3864479-Rhodomonas_salina.1